MTLRVCPHAGFLGSGRAGRGLRRAGSVRFDHRRTAFAPDSGRCTPGDGSHAQAGQADESGGDDAAECVGADRVLSGESWSGVPRLRPERGHVLGGSLERIGKNIRRGVDQSEDGSHSRGSERSGRKLQAFVHRSPQRLRRGALSEINRFPSAAFPFVRGTSWRVD